MTLLCWAPWPNGAVEEQWTATVEWWISGLLLLTCWLRHRQGQPVRWHRSWWPIGGLLILMWLTVAPLPGWVIRVLSPKIPELAGSTYHALSLYRHGTWASWVYWCAGLGVAWCVLQLVDRRERAEAMMKVIVAIAVAVAIAGLAHRVSPWRQGSWAAWPFYNRNYFAAYLGLAIPLALALSVAQKTLERRWILWGLTAVLAMALVASTSRGALVALAGTVAVMGGLWRRHRVVRWRPQIVLGIAGLFLLVVGSAVWRPLVERFHQSLAMGIEGKVMLWRDVWRMAGQFLSTGIGAGAFMPVFPVFQRFSTPLDFVFRYAESDWLEWLVEFGVVGFALLGLAVWWWWMDVGGAMRRFAGRSVAVLLSGVVGGLMYLAIHGAIAFPTRAPAIWVSAWGCVGLGLAMARISEEASAAPQPTEGRRWMAVPARLVIVVGLGGLMVALGIRAGVAWAAARAHGSTSFAHVLKWQPGHLEVRLKLAQALSEEGHMTEAWRVLRDGLPHAPTSPQLKYQLTKTAERLGQDAEPSYRELTAAAPAQAKYYLEWAQYRLASREAAAAPEDIMGLLRQAAELSMVSLDPALEAALSIRGDPRDGLAVTPAGDAEKWLRTGEFLANRGHWAQARQAFDRAQALTSGTPRERETNRRRAKTLVEYQRCEEAAPFLAVLQRDSPDDPWVVGWQGECHVVLGRMAEAIPLLKRAAALATDGGLQVRCRILLADALLASQDSLEAIQHLEAALVVSPTNAVVYQRLGDAYTQAGQQVLAARAYERALAISPHDQGTRERLQQLQTRTR